MILLPSPGQLVTVRQRRFVVTEVKRSELPGDPQQGVGMSSLQNLVSLSSVEDEGTGEELQVVWELEPTAGGQQLWGLLHAKCALADRRLLFLSSANLTGAAMTLNMELGVLIEGGALPRQLGAHFDELVQHGVLRHPSG